MSFNALDITCLVILGVLQLTVTRFILDPANSFYLHITDTFKISLN